MGDDGNDTLNVGTDIDSLLGCDGDHTLNGKTGNDILFGGLGRDTLWGGSGNDAIDAGDGNDSVNAGFGDDSVFGGAGGDTLGGGNGNDTLTGGDGNDIFDFVRGGDADVVTDFSLTDTDGDGQHDDQLDVSDLRDLAGNPVSAWDVTVSDNGSGNALLTSPEGETILLLGVSPAQM